LLGLNVVDADHGTDRRGHFGAITGDHHHALDAAAAKSPDRVRGIWTDGVRQDQRGTGHAIDGDRGVDLIGFGLAVLGSVVFR